MIATPLIAAMGAVSWVSASSRCSTPLGGGSPAVAAARSLSVAAPIAVTTATAVPAAMVVPAQIIEVRSATARASQRAADFTTACDSPVRLDSSTSSPVADSSRQSAGTTSPA